MGLFKDLFGVEVSGSGSEGQRAMSEEEQEEWRAWQLRHSLTVIEQKEYEIKIWRLYNKMRMEKKS